MWPAGELVQRRRLSALRSAVECLPTESRRAMLVGLGEEPIIAGAYSVGPAICPALAAHRRGARTRYSDFARAWDRYARGRGIRRARQDDLASLVAMLMSSLVTAPGSTNGHGPAVVNGNGSAPSALNGNAPSRLNGNAPSALNGNGRTNGNGRPSRTRSKPVPS